ncbi:MAG: GLPGLI family protein [Bacteroidetes bacterium]|nr:GLPGLI family protein [Bacteroidota bacterium]
MLLCIKRIEGKQNNGLESEHGEGKIVIKMDEPDDCSYADLKDRKIYDQREFMSRQFLIESKFDEQIWKLTGNEKSILGYPCQEAVLQDTNKKAIAWFTAAIPVSIGPNGYCNLPGLILSVDVNGGDQVMTATHVDLSTVDSKELSKPKEGKKMSKPEFRKMVAEKQKEMQEENGGGNNVIIRIKK